jgi:hypothetical protein
MNSAKIPISPKQSTLFDYVKPSEEPEQGIYGEIEQAYRDGVIGLHEYWLLTGNYKVLRELPSVEDDLAPAIKLQLAIQRSITRMNRVEGEIIYTADNPDIYLDLKIQRLLASYKLRGKEIIYAKPPLELKRVLPDRIEWGLRSDEDNDFDRYTYIKELPEPQPGVCELCEADEVYFVADLANGHIEKLCYDCGLPIKDFLEANGGVF